MRTFVATIVLALFSLAPAANATYQECTSTITGNFNGTAISGGDYIWFTGVLTVKGLPSSSRVTVYATHSHISFTANDHTYNIKAPNSVITFSPSTSTASTSYAPLSPPLLGTGWNTGLPSTGLAGNDLMSAVSFAVPAAGLPGGIKNVSWTAQFSSFSTSLTVNWQWAAAVYTSFSTDYNALGVKPVDDNKASIYKNSDHAGTPENYKAYVVGGATGGGGSNYTGSYSATGSCALTPDGSSSATISNMK